MSESNAADGWDLKPVTKELISDKPDRTIVTEHGVGENGKDDCSDLTDNNAENEESVPKSFPQKLMDILSNEEHGDIISWLPHGNGFLIHKKKAFANEILPHHFKASKFTSFTRKLNRWGFSRAPRGPETGAYFHKLFCRDKPELCRDMTSNSGTKSYHSTPHGALLPAVPMSMMMGPGHMPFYMPTPQMAMLTPQQQQALWQQQMQLFQFQQMQMMQYQQQGARLPQPSMTMPHQAPMPMPPPSTSQMAGPTVPDEKVAAQDAPVVGEAECKVLEAPSLGDLPAEGVDV